jgi:hypothetical protein
VSLPETAAMMTDTVTCPYCNALVPVAPGAAAGKRVVCRRCGESFALSPGDAPVSGDILTQPAAPAPTAIVTQPAAPQPFVKPTRGNRRFAYLMLGVMGGLFAVALVFALSTQAMRRANDAGITRPNPKRPLPLDDDDSSGGTLPPVPPAKLDALAWLPADTNVIAAVHLREIAGTPAGKELLKQPIKATKRFNFNFSIESLVNSTGFQLDEIQHLVIGVRAEKSAIPALAVPPVVIIVRTRRDYNPRTLLNAMKNKEELKFGARTVYQPRAEGTLKPAVCFLDSNTAAFALIPEVLKDVPAEPQEDLRQLPRELRDVLQKRVGPVGPLWVAGHSDDWGVTQARLLFTNLNRADRDRVFKVRTFAAWVQFGDPVEVRAEFDCRTDEAARDLQKYLDVPDAGGPWTAARADGWLSVQGRTKLDKVLEWLER